MRILLALMSLVLLAGCSAVEALNRLSPQDGVTTMRDLAYGAGPRRRLDVYAPAGARGAPVVVFFYGGSWQGGEKADYAFVARALAQAGIVAIVPDYRVYPEVRFAGFMKDGAAALAFAKRNASRFGGDPDRLVVMGHSAGAHIAAMLALDPRWLGAEGLGPRDSLAGFVGLAGPYDFLPLEDPVLHTIFGTTPQSPPGVGRETQPITFAENRGPPMFLATGLLDTTVRPQNTRSLAARVAAAGGSVVTREYVGLGHAPLIGVLSEPLGFAAPVRRDVTQFILALPPTRARVSAR